MVSKRIAGPLRAAILYLLMITGLAVSGIASDATRYPLCDIRVLYLYDDPAKIDWPTLYYLNDQYGCRIDLATVAAGARFGHETRFVERTRLYAHTFDVITSSSSRFDSVYAYLWSVRRPDMVLVGDLDSNGLTARFAAVTSALKSKTTSLFNILRYGKFATDASAKAVTVNALEFYNAYQARIEREVPLLMREGYEVVVPSRPLSRYQVEVRLGKGGADFVSGLRLLRLGAVIDSLVPSGGIRDALSRKAENFQSLLQIAETQAGKTRLESVVNAYEEITALRDAARVEPSLSRTTDMAAYLDELVEKVRHLATVETGFVWDGRIDVRDSPYGPKVKFASSINIAGPATVLVSRVLFHPYWDSTAVVLDSSRETILPHQAYVREYLLDLDSRKLESPKADSLRFSVELEAGGLPLTLERAVPIWNSPRIAVRFNPPFHFVPPVSALEVDRIVSSMSLNVSVFKPLGFVGAARINLETPTGMFAGAYRQDISLEKGQTMTSIRIPFSISKLFELGVQKAVVTVSVNGRVVDADTGVVRIASCQVPDSLTIGLLADTSGGLEDILRVTDAKWQALTDRTLEVGLLSGYDVILIGSGALRAYPSFRKVRSRIEEYVKGGGTIVVMAQPSDWPSNILPIALAPVGLELAGSGITASDASHDLLKKPNLIAVAGLSNWFTRPTAVRAAIVTPSRPVLVGPDGEMLLSITPVGRGKVVFCGLPLSDMIGTLNIEAIHLFANILNY